MLYTSFYYGVGTHRSSVLSGLLAGWTCGRTGETVSVSQIPFPSGSLSLSLCMSVWKKNGRRFTIFPLKYPFLFSVQFSKKSVYTVKWTDCATGVVLFFNFRVWADDDDDVNCAGILYIQTSSKCVSVDGGEEENGENSV